MQRIRQAARAICIPICAFTSGRFQLADSQSLCCEEAALLGRKCHAEEHPLCCNPSSVEFLKSFSLATDEKARPDDVVKMWLVKRGSERVGAKLVRYSLLTLIIFMLVCTILAIILVTFASNYSPALNDRTQGKYFFAFLFLYHFLLLLLCPSVPLSRVSRVSVLFPFAFLSFPL